jgi:polyisoprenoid-binding protein YceI
MSTTLPAALPTTGTWSVDPIHSTVRFSITHHAIATFRAGFDSISGGFDAESGVLSGSVPVENIDLQGVAKFKSDLLAERFFDGEQHPHLSFASTALDADADADGSVRLTGELTIKGVTQPISAVGHVRGPITVRHNDGHESERLAIDLSTVIDRRDFGITHNNELAEGVLNLGWDVAIEVALELTLS